MASIVTFPSMTFALQVQQTAPLQEKGTSAPFSIAASKIVCPFDDRENSKSSPSTHTVTLDIISFD